ncbi:hypothetical protein MAR_001188 [Mya arenaria]|uniref:Secreted protein n=1 Tax=Mya arenaria TaxID=6604 RepID=A0ABY7FB68_MYAAR|nr:uncharacterized protein LOC128209961 [Mya arenaria]WAR19350.1 hypothetical protein MAR_001188 [Mya arenaria]
MEFKILYVVLLLLLGFEGTDSIVNGIPYIKDCPDFDDHGSWTVSNTDVHRRCILKCNQGYTPNACHVIYLHRDRSNYAHTPHCVKKPSWGQASRAGAGVAAPAPIAASDRPPTPKAPRAPLKHEAMGRALPIDLWLPEINPAQPSPTPTPEPPDLGADLPEPNLCYCQH